VTRGAAAESVLYDDDDGQRDFGYDGAHGLTGEDWLATSNVSVYDWRTGFGEHQPQESATE
jgi:hypothetical protein